MLQAFDTDQITDEEIFTPVDVLIEMARLGVATPISGDALTMYTRKIDYIKRILK